VTFEEFDTTQAVSDRLPEDCFERIATAYLRSGRGAAGSFGSAAATLFDGPDLVAFAVDWLESHVGA
jgi:aminoglycoside 3-N-acetyltransferase